MKWFYKGKGIKIFFYSWQLFFLWPGTSQRTKVLTSILPDRHKKQIKNISCMNSNKYWRNFISRHKSFKFIFYVSCLYDPSFSKTSSTLMSPWKMCLHGTSWNCLKQLRKKNLPSVVMSLNLADECVWWVDFSSNLILYKFVRAELWLSERYSKV